MQCLAHDFAEYSDRFDITYLAEKGHALGQAPGTKTVEHTGLEDYRKKVLELAPTMDAVILGAAVANLMPQKPWVDKFPSHQYGPDDVIPINFVLTPRIITEVKRIAPQTHLFGFKLLANADHDELIRAAYDIVLDSHCTAVFANDRADLGQVFAVTKERAVHPMSRDDICKWVSLILQDEYYHTEFHSGPDIPSHLREELKNLLSRFQDKFLRVENDLIFGTVAIRTSKNAFVTTSRGKKELSTFATVTGIHHGNRVVHVSGNKRTKATLNAPLLHCIFRNPKVHYIVHYHEPLPNTISLSYAPPGTIRDSLRSFTNITSSFNIDHHGCFLLLDKEGNQL